MRAEAKIPGLFSRLTIIITLAQMHVINRSHFHTNALIRSHERLTMQW